jgi:hypothetical protein
LDPEADPRASWFRIDLAAAGEPGRWSSSILGFDTLEHAIAHLVGLVGAAVEWDVASE